MWFKYLLNVGVNQACTVYETDYGHVTSPGPICEEMKEAMREVCRLAAVEGIELTEADIEAAIELEKTLKPDGYPSMRQDALAGRPTEVDLFAGTVIAMGHKYDADFSEYEDQCVGLPYNIPFVFKLKSK